MRITLILIGAGAVIVGALLWQSQPSKRILMTDDHPALVDLELPPDASALIAGAPVGTRVDVHGAPLREAIDETAPSVTATKEGVDPRGEITPDFERGVCFLYRVAFGQGYVTVDGKQYDCR